MPYHFDRDQSAGPGTLAGELPAATEAPKVEPALWAIILAGGIGSRFWPLSSPQRPKQLLALVSDRPLITETVDRLEPLVSAERVLVLTSRDIAPAIAASLPDVPAANILVEPRPMGTAASLAWGASVIAERGGPESIFFGVHADLAVAFVDSFRHVLREASRLAAIEDVLVAIGVRPTRAEPGFGYLVPGTPFVIDVPLHAGGACRVTSYVEKPSAERARELLRRNALWHSGVIAARARVAREAIARHTHELWDGLAALDERDYDRYFTQIRSVSIERGVLERTDRLVVLPGDFGWDDVGTWAALRRARDLDDSGNGAFGEAVFVDATGNVVHADGGRVVMYGVAGLLVVSLPGLTFVTTLERAADLKPLLDGLPPDLRTRKSD